MFLTIMGLEPQHLDNSMKAKYGVNAAFLKNAGGNTVGGDADIVVAAPRRNPNVNYAANAGA